MEQRQVLSAQVTRPSPKFFLELNAEIIQNGAVRSCIVDVAITVSPEIPRDVPKFLY
jgi:hypothetical protein